MGNEEDFFSDYDDATSDVTNSSHQTFENNLRRWFSTIEMSPVAGPLEKIITDLIDFDYLKIEIGAAMIVGTNAKLDWPRSPNEYLAKRLQIFRGFSNESLNPLNFAHKFYQSSSTRLDDFISLLVTNLFMPTARDFRKQVERTIRDVATGDIALASDRIVTRSDNFEKFAEIEIETDKVIKGINESNILAGLEEKHRLIAEIAAGSDVMKQNQSRWGAIKNTILVALKYLLHKISDTAIGLIIKKLIGLIFEVYHISPF